LKNSRHFELFVDTDKVEKTSEKVPILNLIHRNSCESNLISSALLHAKLPQLGENHSGAT
jgi:hypothetical protein